MPVVTLQPGHVQPVWAGHPWVYAQAVKQIEGGALPGSEVEVRDPRGRALGRGLYSPNSAIVVRLYSRDAHEPLDARWLEAHLAAAIERRVRLGLPDEGTTGYRLVHAEGDGIPGLIVDRFGDSLAVQFGTIGMKMREDLVFAALQKLLSPTRIFDRSSTRLAKAEGFESPPGVVRGPTGPLQFRELGLTYEIPVELGQKTGYYADQRPLRRRVAELAPGRRVLDTFCYVGSLGMNAARAGAAEVKCVDQSVLALEVGADCARRNGLTGKVVFDHRNAQDALAQAGRDGGYDLVICDPPKLAPNRAALKRGLASLRHLTALGCRATRSGGLLVVTSCSAAIGMAEVQRAVALGARDVDADAFAMEWYFQGPDHPIPSAFPEGRYLSTVIAEVRR